VTCYVGQFSAGRLQPPTNVIECNFESQTREAYRLLVMMLNFEKLPGVLYIAFCSIEFIVDTQENVFFFVLTFCLC
jgi:hypothetical protein